MKLSALLPGFVLFPFSAQANPACVVCTVAVGASLEIARRLGISTVKTQKYRGYRSLRLKLSKFFFLFGSFFALLTIPARVSCMFVPVPSDSSTDTDALFLLSELCFFRFMEGSR